MHSIKITKALNFLHPVLRVIFLPLLSRQNYLAEHNTKLKDAKEVICFDHKLLAHLQDISNLQVELDNLFQLASLVALTLFINSLMGDIDLKRSFGVLMDPLCYTNQNFTVEFIKDFVMVSHREYLFIKVKFQTKMSGLRLLSFQTKIHLLQVFVQTTLPVIESIIISYRIKYFKLKVVLPNCRKVHRRLVPPMVFTQISLLRFVMMVAIQTIHHHLQVSIQDLH